MSRIPVSFTPIVPYQLRGGPRDGHTVRHHGMMGGDIWVYPRIAGRMRVRIAKDGSPLQAEIR